MLSQLFSDLRLDLHPPLSSEPLAHQQLFDLVLHADHDVFGVCLELVEQLALERLELPLVLLADALLDDLSDVFGRLLRGFSLLLLSLELVDLFFEEFGLFGELFDLVQEASLHLLELLCIYLFDGLFNHLDALVQSVRFLSQSRQDVCLSFAVDRSQWADRRSPLISLCR